MPHSLTDEQQVAVAHFQTGESLKIEAFAGAGKTSTLVALAESAKAKSGHYFAFNKAIADDAKSRFSTTKVSASTVHSVAFMYVTRAFSFAPQKLKQSPTVNQVAHVLQAQPKGAYRLFNRLDLTEENMPQSFTTLSRII
jgi:ABC-type dipeptide/oligopeptide/nickel transport system ATPase subunit